MKPQGNPKPFAFPRGSTDGNRNKLLVTAAWQSFPKPYGKGDIWLGRDADGTPIGVNDDRHIATGASNRGGKGSGLIIPNLCLWPGSTVVIDPKVRTPISRPNTAPKCVAIKW